MRKILTLITLLALNLSIKAQTISLGVDNEYCPNVEYEFTVTLPGPYKSISATQMLITQQPTAFNQARTTFKFKAKFNDVNIKQFVEIIYRLNNADVPYKPEYKRVKSLFYANDNSCGVIQPKFTSNNAPVTSFNAPSCQITNFSITFAKIKWHTAFETPMYCFGSISDYEYLLPAGWKLGTSTSNGSTYLPGTNTATITSDLSTGNGSTILIRPKNTCGGTITNGQIPVQVVIIRSSANPAMSASPNSIPCGSTSPVVFTIRNTSTITGISGYEWNLGNNNGWLYNGNPAPATIPTTTNTITLEPACGGGLVAPTASVIVTNAATNCNIHVAAPALSVSAPSLTMQGTASICSGTANYSVLGLPCNATVIWSIDPPAGIANLNATTRLGTSLTKVGDGNVTLTAKVTACATEYPVSHPIHAGTYTSADYTMNGGNSTTQPLYWCPNQTYGFSVSPTNGSNYVWAVPTGWTSVYNGGYVNAMRVPAGTTPPTGTVSVSFTEPCGTTITKSFFAAYSSSACTGTDPRFTYSPNPAPSYLYVAVVSAYISTTKIQRIQVVRSGTGLTIFDQNYRTPGVLSAYITTSGFLTGNHILRIYDGSTWASYQFVR